ncbi:hypothetical protein CEP52_011699 [Fusarium oligoseptatum]|uniref:DUF7703 domain-containing protein n=1 Tax=Fusarium oligoseptatum TaxID=2604345 RepID=A0A428T215_9HYPO|nr:hypothetical protein CEP52_011699 [Fusarium oligoseptatum]
MWHFQATFFFGRTAPSIASGRDSPYEHAQPDADHQKSDHVSKQAFLCHFPSLPPLSNYHDRPRRRGSDLLAMAATGETGPISAPLPINMIIAGFFAVACYNCVEILISLLNRFKRHEGLYFWSMLTATLGIVLHSIVVLLRYYSLGPNFPLCVLTCIGWYGMVTGQSVVLYSRLHLIVDDKTKTRWVLGMIITNFFILHVPVTILFLGSNTRDSHRYLAAFNIYERIQLAGFFLQETIISGLYIWETARGLKPIFAIKKALERKIIRNLIIVNVFGHPPRHKPAHHSVPQPLPDPNDIQARRVQHQVEDGICRTQQTTSARTAQGLQLHAYQCRFWRHRSYSR